MRPLEVVAQGPEPTSTPAPMWTPGPTPTLGWRECGPVPPWWGLQTPSPRWFTLCGHCRGIWPTQTPRWFPSPTPHPYFATTTPITVPVPTVTPTSTPRGTPVPTPTPTPEPVAILEFRDSHGYEGSLERFGLPAGGVAYPVYPGWELWGSFDVTGSGGAGTKRMIEVHASVPLTLTVGIGYHDWTDKYCEGWWAATFRIGTEDFGGPAEQPFAQRGNVFCWDDDLYPPAVYRHYLTALDSAFAFVVSVARSRLTGWWYIRVEGVQIQPLPPTPAPTVTSTPAVTPTPAGGSGDCQDPNPGGDVEVVPVPRVGTGLCAGVGPVDASLPLVGSISVPQIRICFVPIWFGSIDLMGVKINLDLVFAAAAGAMILRWFWRS